jgi:hypothetical protein
MGTNPAIVMFGPKKGMQILRDESDKAFQLLHSLSKDQLAKTLINTSAPNEIITYVNRKAMIEKPEGLTYGEMGKEQKEMFWDLVTTYVHRYTKLFAGQMIKEITDAGPDNLRFAWAGATELQIGKPHYYRIQGPTLIIEYDNSQNNANHVHSVVRDLNHDFGGDELLNHYNQSHR